MMAEEWKMEEVMEKEGKEPHEGWQGPRIWAATVRGAALAEAIQNSLMDSVSLLLVSSFRS